MGWYADDAAREHFLSAQGMRYVRDLLAGPLRDTTVYAIGGAVRDALLGTRHAADIDLVYDDQRAPDALRVLYAYTHERSRLGSPRWRPTPGITLDVVPLTNLENTRMLPDPYAVARSLDLTTSAFLYDFSQGAFFALPESAQSLARQEVDVLCWREPTRAVHLTRVALHSERLGFSVGPNARRRAKERFDSRDVEDMRRYLSRKGLAHTEQSVLSRITALRAA